MKRSSPFDRSIGSDLMGREERLRELGKVTGELLHDMGSALAVLTGRIALARDEASLGRIPTDELARIGADSEELRAMVLEVLSEVRGLKTPVEATFSVVATLEGAVNRWLIGAPHVSASLHSSLPPGSEISGARSFFSRATGNLLRNAARHARSEIRLTARPVREGRWVEIRVEDDGQGVPEEIRPMVFEPFVTGTQVGTGLGLSFARWGIERLGGTLELDADPSSLGGASFRMSLPLSTMGRRPPRGRSEPRAVPPSVQATPLQGLRIVVVDDDAAVRTTFTRLLRRSGAEAFGLDPSPWRTLQEGAERVAECTPDAILLDLSLGRFSGERLAQALRGTTPSLFPRIVLFTGGTPPSDDHGLPVISKLLPWDEIVARLLGVASSS